MTRLSHSISPLTATLLIALSAFFFGLVPLFARNLQGEEVTPAAIALYRFFFSAFLLLPFLPLRAGPKRRQAGLMIASGMTMGLGWIGYLQAIETGPVAAAGVVYMSYPIFTLLFAWILLGQRPGWRSAGAAALVLLAALVLGLGGPMTGDFMALIYAIPAPVSFGLVVLVISGMTPDLSPLERMSGGMIGAVLGLAPLALMTASPAELIPATAAGWWSVAALGCLTALMPQLVYSLAAPKAGPARTAMAGATELPVMVLVGWVMFAEVVGLREYLAVGLVLAAILVVPAVKPAPGSEVSSAALAGPRPFR